MYAIVSEVLRKYPKPAVIFVTALYAAKTVIGFQVKDSACHAKPVSVTIICQRPDKSQNSYLFSVCIEYMIDNYSSQKTSFSSEVEWLKSMYEMLIPETETK